MNEAVIALDSEHSITLMNRTALEFLGRAEAALGEPFIHHLRVPAIHNALRGCTEPITCEFDLPGTSDGSAARRIMARVSPEPLSGGYILVMHDVTSVRRLETVRRDFVANVSHELRTPVSIIRANAETLLDGAMSDPVHGARLMDGLQRNAERLSRLLEDLLDLARLEAERYTTQIEEVEVATAVVRAIDSIERAAHSKQIELQVAVDSDLRMRVDDKALDQILVNYLDNAVKYTPDGGRVVVSARASDDHRGPVITVEVADNGPGIAAHHRERVFERFYRVDPGRSRDMGGTGLGLSIVKHLAEAMDGEAGVEANEPQGSRFWIRLPRA
ncbi:MAG: ATP-binding protein [Myxococcota bacterium]